jgi:hypothetical protein
MCLDSMSRRGCNSQQVTIDLVHCRRATQSEGWSSLGVAWSFKSVQAHDGKAVVREGAAYGGAA